MASAGIAKRNNLPQVDSAGIAKRKQCSLQSPRRESRSEKQCSLQSPRRESRSEVTCLKLLRRESCAISALSCRGGSREAKLTRKLPPTASFDCPTTSSEHRARHTDRQRDREIDRQRDRSTEGKRVTEIRHIKLKVQDPTCETSRIPQIQNIYVF